MKNSKMAITCTACDGIGEEVLIPAGDGYGAEMDECITCDGKGWVEVDPSSEYDPDKM